MPTLTVATTTLTLPDDLLWVDEHQWSPVRQALTPTLTGALVVEAAALQAGRPITLKGDVTWGWMPRTALETLRGWSATPGLAAVLNLRGIDHDVMFRHHDAPALEAQPIVDYLDPDNADWYAVTLKLMEI